MECVLLRHTRVHEVSKNTPTRRSTRNCSQIDEMRRDRTTEDNTITQTRNWNRVIVNAQPGHTGDITAVQLSMGFSVSLL